MIYKNRQVWNKRRRAILKITGLLAQKFHVAAFAMRNDPRFGASYCLVQLAKILYNWHETPALQGEYHSIHSLKNYF